MTAITIVIPIYNEEAILHAAVVDLRTRLEHRPVLKRDLLAAFGRGIEKSAHDDLARSVLEEAWSLYRTTTGTPTVPEFPLLRILAGVHAFLGGVLQLAIPLGLIVGAFLDGLLPR